MGFFGTLRGQKTSPVQQIESLNSRLEKARVIVTEGRIFPVLNKEGHYVVWADQENGYYVVDTEGCCTNGQQRVDLLDGYCEHRLAVDILNETREAETVVTTQPEAQHQAETVKTTQPEAQSVAEAENSYGDTPPAEKPPVAQRNGKVNGARSRKGAAEAIIAAESLLQPVNGAGAKSNGAHASGPESDPQ